VGGAAPLLSPGRLAALAGLLAALGLYHALAGVLPSLSIDGEVAFVALLVIPVSFAAVWVALPLARMRGVLALGVALLALAAVLDVLGADSLFNLAKLLGFALVGFWFLSLFQLLWWVVLIAVLIPAVDAVSVWRGPTSYVVDEQPGLFDRISVAFRVPGGDGSANIGPPDVLFFALFLAAAERFGLRTGWTWAAMTALLALTLALTAWLEISGLPALPAVCVGFLLPNADLIWKELRDRRGR
jgi:hypothetical protein